MTAPSGRHPAAKWHDTPNHWDGHDRRLAVVIHINEGGFDQSIRYMRANGTSAHFEVGRDGRVAQLVDLGDSAWCNGLSYDRPSSTWICPHGKRVAPTWRLLRPEDGNPNRNTISVENEGFSGQPMPAPQFNANVELLVFAARQYPALAPYVVGTTLIGHFHLDTACKKRCPGSGVDLAALATAANAALGLSDVWRAAWQSKGVALPADQVGWAIPQAYRAKYQILGGCLVAETYVHSGISIAVFEGGYIVYTKASREAVVTLVPVGVS